jgi:hypothetical protein
LQDLGINGRIILKNGSVRKNLGGMDWIDLAEDRDKWQVLMDMVMY